MEKKEIIKMVNELAHLKDFKLCLTNSKSNNTAGSKIGTSQFLSLANTVRQAECIEEIILLIEYKVAKGNGWNIKIGGGSSLKKEFGRHIVDCITKIADGEREQKGKIGDVSKFFGYLFWKAKAVA